VVSPHSFCAPPYSHLVGDESLVRQGLLYTIQERHGRAANQKEPISQHLREPTPRVPQIPLRLISSHSSQPFLSPPTTTPYFQHQSPNTCHSLSRSYTRKLFTHGRRRPEGDETSRINCIGEGFIRREGKFSQTTTWDSGREEQQLSDTVSNAFKMPGILPMKVIKVGSNSQSRIAQACDRCRSKKIRCDGIRPCCSQCANVGFECKTSDKLSRRAFPRGYTESLEERVRALEAEVRELKDLLDEKDEKIDMLSKMHSNRRPSMTLSTSSSPPVENRKESIPTPPKEDIFRVQASPLLLGSENSDLYFMGASSGRAFVGRLTERR
jgi:hypothetical protein